MTVGQRRVKSHVGATLLGIGIAATMMLAPGCGSTPEARMARIFELKQDPTPGNVESIRELAGDPSPDVRATAIHALVSVEAPDGVEVALGGLEDTDSFVRRIAAKALGDAGDPSALTALSGLLVEDEDYRVRQAAAEGLSLIDGPDAVTSLAEGLEDPVKEVRLAALRGINKLDPSRVFDTLSAMVLEDPEWEIRVHAAAGLGKSGRQEARTALEAAVDDPNEFVRAAVANALQALE